MVEFRGGEMEDPGDIKSMSCEEFQSLLPDLIATGEDVKHHPHCQACGLCRALIDDLNQIAKDTLNRRGGEDRP